MPVPRRQNGAAVTRAPHSWFGSVVRSECGTHLCSIKHHTILAWLRHTGIFQNATSAKGTSRLLCARCSEFQKTGAPTGVLVAGLPEVAPALARRIPEAVRGVSQAAVPKYSPLKEMSF